MTEKRDVAPPVLEVIRVWVIAGDTDEAAVALKKARLGLDAEHIPSLVTEIAWITAQSMIEVLAMQEGLDEPGDPIDVEGLQMHPKQVERLSRWAIDLEPTAEALGIDGKTFLTRVRDATNEAAQDAPAESDAAKAKKLLGSDDGAFENRPELGTSKQAGLAGRLAALNFDKK